VVDLPESHSVTVLQIALSDKSPDVPKSERRQNVRRHVPILVPIRLCAFAVPNDDFALSLVPFQFEFGLSKRFDV